MEHKIVTALSFVIASMFAINIFYYGPSEGTWATLELYDRMIVFLGDLFLHILNIIFMK